MLIGNVSFSKEFLGCEHDQNRLKELITFVIEAKYHAACLFWRMSKEFHEFW